MQGLWTMRYSTGDDGLFFAGGVMHADGAKVWGGDGGMWFTGEVTETDGGIRGRLELTRYVKEMQYVWPGLNVDRVALIFQGGAHPQRFWGTVTVEGNPSLKCTLELERVA